MRWLPGTSMLTSVAVTILLGDKDRLPPACDGDHGETEALGRARLDPPRDHPTAGAGHHLEQFLIDKVHAAVARPLDPDLLLDHPLKFTVGRGDRQYSHSMLVHKLCGWTIVVLVGSL